MSLHTGGQSALLRSLRRNAGSHQPDFPTSAVPTWRGWPSFQGFRQATQLPTTSSASNLGSSSSVRGLNTDPAKPLHVVAMTATSVERRGGSPATSRPTIPDSATAPPTLPPSSGRAYLAYELVQGALVRWSEVRDRALPPPPTAVLLHGILGGRRNWASFSKRLAQEFPSWQFLLVDLRCHGDSSHLPISGPHTVQSAAQDVLKLMGHLRITPRVLIGHSFGGKVALSMVDQAAKPLPRPIRVWVLDATPGTVRAGLDGEDHPAELIAALQQLPATVPSRRAVIDALLEAGFSSPISQWMTTNLRQIKEAPSTNGRPSASSSGFTWVFDLLGIEEMYDSYERTNLWPIVESVPAGVHIDFLRAERSLHRWAHEDRSRIGVAERQASAEGAGVQMHVLEDAGHWVHTDNPDGLFRLLAPSFGDASFRSKF
eukprot:TRINITY_DN18468_c0_g1_i1.p1 TRINITY_DN18468_c0_g1~~TRINITY_DN18468_c0_g1_i1.p1  ORF type:complete len:430 (-),score=57.28 TRINITY_DN18468_c0_g1_i1:285-1574(-)